MVDEQDARAPGWKRDPWGRFAGRYWDGEAWTEHVVTAEKLTTVDPVPSVPPPPRDGPSAAQPAVPPVVQPVAPVSQSRPARRRRVPLWVKIAVPVVVLIGIAAAAGSGKKTPSTVASNGTTGTGSPATPAVSAKSSYVVGDTAKTGDFDVTVYGDKDPQPPVNQFEKPKAGDHYVSVDVQVANKTAKQLTFSSIIGLHLVDAANRQYDETISSLTPTAPDGQIAANEAVRGFVVFEVPDGTTGLRLRVQGNVTASGAFFTLA